MTKIMAVTMIPVLAMIAFVAGPNQGPSQDAKSVAIDATEYAKITIEPVSNRDQQRRREAVQRADRQHDREVLKERREKAKARAEAKAARKAERQAARAEARAEAATQATTQAPSGGSTSSGGLPELLLFIRSQESGGNYSAYNGSGCEGYGCGGAYQMHARYASGWAANAGYPGMSSNAANWPADIQDAVALELFYSTNPDGAHWCNWTDYC